MADILAESLWLESIVIIYGSEVKEQDSGKCFWFESIVISNSKKPC